MEGPHGGEIQHFVRPKHDVTRPPLDDICIPVRNVGLRVVDRTGARVQPEQQQQDHGTNQHPHDPAPPVAPPVFTRIAEDGTLQG